MSIWTALVPFIIRSTLYRTTATIDVSGLLPYPSRVTVFPVVDFRSALSEAVKKQQPYIKIKEIITF